MKGRWPDQPTKSSGHNSYPAYFGQTGRIGYAVEAWFKANAIAKTEQHLPTEEQHAGLVQHIFNAVTQSSHWRRLLQETFFTTLLIVCRMSSPSGTDFC